MRILYTIMCIGKKLYCYSAEGEFLTEKNPGMIYYSIADFNKDTAWMIDEVLSHLCNMGFYESNSFVQLDGKLRNKCEFHLLKTISRESKKSYGISKDLNYVLLWY